MKPVLSTNAVPAETRRPLSFGKHIPRFAVVSHYVPPSRFGQPRVLYRLLRRLPPDQYGLISTTRYDRSDQTAEHDGPWLSAPYFRIEPGFPWRLASHRPGHRHFPRQIHTIANLACATLRRARSIEELVRAQRYEVIIACSGDPVDLPASALTARRLGVRFIAYMFDDYGTQYKILPPYQRFASICDRFVVKRADRIIVPNEMLQDEYFARHNACPAIVRNPHGGVYAPAEDRPLDVGGIRIVYTGAVYHVHDDAFGRLTEVMDSDGRPMSLHLYSSVPTEQNPVFRGSPRVHHHGHVNDEQVLSVQAGADILFLPLAFNSPAPDVVRTALPGKFAEYLASGRPMLVHAPHDAFVSWYCRRHQCALVVDRPDPRSLAEGIQGLVTDHERRRRIVAAALRCAREDFDPLVAERAFLDVLSDILK